MIEILAPLPKAGNLNQILDAGCDSVYAGLKGFGSRPSDADLTLDELSECRDECHKRGRRLYVAMNSVLDDIALKKAEEAIVALDSIGCDAVILSDFALIRFAASCLKNCEVHVSTLAGVQNSLTAQLFYQIGAKRVVASSNLTFSEIAKIVERVPGLDIEVIAEGGVCFNDNRLCNLPHSLKSDCYAVGCKCEYYLAEGGARERIDLGGHLLDGRAITPILYDIGVRSLKIEGRTRDASYICAASRALCEARRSCENSPRDVSALHYVSRSAEYSQWVRGGRRCS